MDFNFELLFAILWLLLNLFLVGFIVMLFVYVFHANRKNSVGYLPTFLDQVGLKLEKVIENYVSNTKEITIIEPGAGFANVAYYLSQKFTWKEVIGLENEIGTLLIGKFKQIFRKKGVRLIKADIYKYEYPENSVIYCYLLNNMLDEMHRLGKFKNTLVISLSFSLSDIEPTEVIEINGFQKKLIVYDFRV